MSDFVSQPGSTCSTLILVVEEMSFLLSGPGSIGASDVVICASFSSRVLPLLFAVALPAFVTAAEVRTVCPDGSCDFTTIQAAVDASSDGDEILVGPGTYRSTHPGHVVDLKGRAITLRSTAGADQTIIDCQNNRRGIVCFNGEGSDTVISGFRILDGRGVFYPYFDDEFEDESEISGGGMLVILSSPRVTDCEFFSCTGYKGGAMYNGYQASVDILDCTFVFNSAQQDGGAIFNVSCSPTLSRCTINQNSAQGNGGGMFNDWQGEPTLLDCIMKDNTADSGAAMANYQSSPSVVGTLFEDNSGRDNGGAVSNQDGSDASFTDCCFRSNDSDYEGGAMYIRSSTPTLSRCEFDSNRSDSSGGAIYNFFSRTEITECSFRANQGMDGGAIKSLTLGPEVTDSLFCANFEPQVSGPWTNFGGNIFEDACPCNDSDADGVCDEDDQCPGQPDLDSDGDGIADCLDCLTDFNNDGVTNGQDLSYVLAAWNGSNSVYDVSGDGVVSGPDLTIVLAEWGPCDP